MNKPLSEERQGERYFPTEEQLQAFANNFASVVQTPMVIWLEGDLGAGKTSFARALIHSLGYQGGVKSPTYGLLEHYQLHDLHVLHLDLYRIGDPGELEYLGIVDLMDERVIVLIEWPERGEGVLPPADFIFRFSYADQGRKLQWQTLTELGRNVVSNLEFT